MPTNQSNLHITEVLLLFHTIRISWLGMRSLTNRSQFFFFNFLCMIAKSEIFLITSQLKDKLICFGCSDKYKCLNLEWENSYCSRCSTWFANKSITWLFIFNIFWFDLIFIFLFLIWISLNGFLVELQGWSIYIMVASHL